ncbi:MAG: bifunctional (p)ppGpp synthetase/guanosine-3',5'-bis(diphosphate) 3'-pyrophosphohydrolase [Rhodobacterales bacterium]|nr:MAG: bifunctional (p)ppGpp synthetase/guanosine-3',5'-bis(diphosphate) 3'-pyrophosphohydrolase [Rhodobacterales bacterium]
MHRDQWRKSGEPYFTHPIAVAGILAEQNLDDATIITGLLHDTIEDTESSYQDIAEEFSPEIAELVDGVTNLTKIELSSSETKQAENFRKLFMAMSKDIRVILVKFADRLHNMRTIDAMRREKQVQKARETMDIYAPLAGRMGMQGMREELEDLAFKTLNPEARASIMRRYVSKLTGTDALIEEIQQEITDMLAAEGIEAQVYGRAKRPYSIWRKMEAKKLTFSMVSDVFGFRVITRTREDCYRALGLIHGKWEMVPGRFKDYISQPKTNGYRSIHTTVSGHKGRRIEVQIRTMQMHQVAEVGVAAHWSYRDGVRVSNPFAVDPAKWVARLSERLENADDHTDFLEHVKLEMYADKVFCFTPKGEVVKLPRGATPLDFAYAVHTDIGDNCTGAKVNGSRVPLWSRLRNGQAVEIITAEGGEPEAVWVDIVATGRAKSAIRRRLRIRNRNKFISSGRTLARIGFEHVGRELTDKVLETAARQLGLPDKEELLARIGSSELAVRDVIAAVYPEATENGTIDPEDAVIGLEPGQSHEIAQCCQPLPGERIVGIKYPGRGIVVHAIYCEVLEELAEESDRWVDVHWHSGEHAAEHTVSLDVTISNDAGVLGRLCTLIGEQNANISDMRFEDRKPDFFRLVIDVELRDRKHLSEVMLVLEAERDVAEVKRHRDLRRKP